MSDFQNIVIVGGSVAGHGLLNALIPDLPQSHRIILIDSKPFAQWPISALRAAVVPGWEKRVTLPITPSNSLPKGSDHVILAPNKVVELREDCLVLEKEFEGKRELPFFRCVLAMGSRQPFPMRAEDGSTEEEYHGQLIKMQEDVKKATKVVIIGGGSVGTEMAGEIRVVYPEKSISLIHSGKQLLNPNAPPKTTSGARSYGSPPNTPKLSNNLEKLLRDQKVDLILGEKVSIPSDNTQAGSDEWNGKAGPQGGLKRIKLASGQTVEADWVFVSVGNQANSELVKEVDEGALVDGMGKMIDVDDYLKVRSTSTTSKLVGRYYAIGDVCASKGFKTSQTAASDAIGAAANIINEVKNRPLKVFVRPTMHAVVIPFGNTGGVGQMTLPLVGTVSLPSFAIKSAKAHGLLVEEYFVKAFNGEEKPTIAAVPA